MPEVIFPGPEGRLEGRYHPQKDRDAPIAIILHPHPQFGGTMNNKVVIIYTTPFLIWGLLFLDLILGELEKVMVNLIMDKVN